MRSPVMSAAAVLALTAMAACADDGVSPPDAETPSLALIAGEQGGRPFTVALTGEAEAPGPGDPDGSGTARLTLNPGQGEVCFILEVSDITLPATGAHIHEAPVGEPGPIVVPLTAPDASGSASGCVDADRALIRDIIRSPGDYYVNVHTSDFPPGAVRGQLSR